VEKKTELILVVDDEQITLELVKDMLEGEGYTVDLASDGRTALAKIAVHKPDLVILDINLPDITGYEVLTKIKEKSSIPVIMLTAAIGPESAVKSLDLGADDFMGKPFSILELVARVNTKLRKAKSQPVNRPVK
jgi:DNA-binding response OmpR family regulator